MAFSVRRRAPPAGSVNVLEHARVIVRDLDVPGHVKLEAIAMLGALVALTVRAQAAGAGSPQQSAQRQAAQFAYLGGVIVKGDHPHLAAALADQAAPRADAPEAQMDTILRRVLPGLLLHQ